MEVDAPGTLAQLKPLAWQNPPQRGLEDPVLVLFCQ